MLAVEGRAAGAGTPLELFVGHDDKPFDIFVVTVGTRRLVGRKEPESYRPGISPTRKGALVGLQSMMGELLDIRQLERGYLLRITPTPAAETAALIASASSEVDLSYPLRRLKDGRETAPDMNYWSERAQAPSSLDDDEDFLRDETLSCVAPLLASGSRLFDPACSTGAFLATLGRAVPGARTIGQDVNAAMVALARTRLDEAHCADASQPQCPPGSIDLLACRHLNLDVVTSAVAAAMFPRLVECVRPGGLVLVIGHTPILLGSDQLVGAGLELLRSVGRSPSGHALFQFYLLRKPR